MEKNDLGPFPFSYEPITFQEEGSMDIFFNALDEIKGIPTDWKNVRKGMIVLDVKQFLYQNYKSGKMPAELYEGIKSEGQMIFEEDSLSAQPIRCYVAIISGENPDGTTQVWVDRNNNFDLSDDNPITVNEYEPSGDHKTINDFVQANQIRIRYEAFSNGKIQKRTTPYSIFKTRKGLYGYHPQYYQGTFPESGEEKFLIVQAEPNNVSSQLLLVDKDDLKTPQSDDNLITEGQYIRLGDNFYQYRGLDPLHRLLILKKSSTNKDDIHSPQIGFNAPLFEGKEFSTGQQLDLQHFKGKYLFIDFWGTWCHPCVVSHSIIKEAYDQIDHEKIAFLGIARDSRGALKKFIDNHEVPWLQILADDANDILSKYQVTAYPTAYLIDPDGKIVAKISTQVVGELMNALESRELLQ